MIFGLCPAFVIGCAFVALALLLVWSIRRVK
jgi:hypothetical protein